MSSPIMSKYRVLKKIGKGSFGEVFQAQDLSSGLQVAVKIEPVSSTHPQLQYESRILRILEGTKGVPSIHFSGKDEQNYYMIIDLLGPSLEELLNLSNRKMSIKTVLMLASQLISIIECIHSKNYIHRDIKPQNFLMGIGEQTPTVHVIDFGLAKRFRDSMTGQHIVCRTGKKLTGTARYVSLYTHMGVEQSRRDDLEGLGYLFVYLLCGKLPWQDVDARDKEEKYQKIFEVKRDCGIDKLCTGLPAEFKEFLRYARSLEFEECPDYEWIQGRFSEVFRREKYLNDSVYDWTRMAFRKDSFNIEEGSQEKNW